jgi:AcrR family transcriptional regulator
MSKHQPEEVRRRQILDAAKQCFIARGLDATTMRDVAKQADLSLGGIYFHFNSKEEIFRAVCTETYGTVLRRWISETGDYESTEAFLRGLALINLNQIETDPDYFRLALVLNAAAVVDDELKRIKREHHQGFVEVIESSLRKAIDSDEFADHNCRSIAESIVALFDGFYLRGAIGADVHPRESISATLDLIIDGLKK